MNNEIKEINIKTPGQILDYVDTKDHLLDLFNYITKLQENNDNQMKYIADLLVQITNLQQENEILAKRNNELKNIKDERFHNLQQENERLKENNSDMQEEMARTWEKCEDYKSRCEKAIEYVNNTIEDKPLTDFDCGSNNACNDLLNILQNGGDNE